MKVYIAGSYAAKEKLKQHANDVMSLGHIVLSNWLYWEPPKDMPPKMLDSVIAAMDSDGVKAADVVIVDTTITSTKGGFHVELGMAIGYNQAARDGHLKQIWVVALDTLPNGFYSHYYVECQTWTNVIAQLRDL